MLRTQSTDAEQRGGGGGTVKMSNNDVDGYKNVTLKVKSHCLKLNRVYSISFN